MVAVSARRFEHERPNILQAFVQPSQDSNTVYKAIWTQNTLTVLRLTNLNSLADSEISLQERAVTAEDENTGTITTQELINMTA